ncbi:MAG: hypothetical protein LBG72_09970 [Spirochaetaceae bacterium]|jgi:hypothetical protein|nr:hypothetical protein [Spirochaetaceae bacterium]
MRKSLTYIITGLLLALFCAVPCAALDLSIGLGGFYSNTGTTIKNVAGDSLHSTLLNKQVNSGGGGFLFFDAKFVELNVDFGLDNGSFSTKDAFWTEGPVYDASSGKNYEKGESVFPVDKIASTGTLGWSLFVKIPVKVWRFSFFPMLGANFNIFLFGRKENGELLTAASPLTMQYMTPQAEPDAFPQGERRIMYGAVGAGSLNNLWLKAGLGFDFDITDAFYFRFEFLYGVQMFNMWEFYSYQIVFLDGGGTQSIEGAPKNLSVKLGLGLKLKKRYNYSGGGAGGASTDGSKNSGGGQRVKAAPRK